MTNPQGQSRADELGHRKDTGGLLKQQDLINGLRDEFTHIVTQTESDSAMGEEGLEPLDPAL